ncbi:hypothetical protein DXG01_010830 [Tephrocybe rancida]|nr:hypothetical protein DXG01_010830 [Tephrocybe rancida]
MFFKTLLTVLTAACAMYKGVQAVDCTVITAPTAISWYVAPTPAIYSDHQMLTGLVGITATQLKKFNPGVMCSLIKKGQKLCVTAGTLPTNSTGAAMATVEASINVTDGNNVEDTLQALHAREVQDDIHWDTPAPGDCVVYGIRKYTARLWGSQFS